MTDKYAELREALPKTLPNVDGGSLWHDIAALLAERDALALDKLEAQSQIEHLDKENERLRKALDDAAKSLETINRESGRGGLMEHMDQVRGYAHSRAIAARAALGEKP